MIKRLFKIFFGIPVCYILLFVLSELLISKSIFIFFVKESTSFETVNVIRISLNLFFCILGMLIYVVIYRTILSKCDFCYYLGESIKREWCKRNAIIDKIKNSKFFFSIVLVLSVSLVIISGCSNFFYNRKHGIQANFSISFNMQSLVAPIFEEFIWRKIYFEYCERYNINHSILLNIIIFSFSHLIPRYYVILLGIILTYTYKKYDSLLINTLIHFLFNSAGFIILLIQSIV